MLTEKDEKQIKSDADDRYWIMAEESFDDSYRDYDDYVKERLALQRAYITGATEERQRAKVLVEALEFIKKMTVNTAIRVKINQSLSSYKPIGI